MLTLGPLGARPAMNLVEERGLRDKAYVARIDVGKEMLNGVKRSVILCAVS